MVAGVGKGLVANPSNVFLWSTPVDVFVQSIVAALGPEEVYQLESVGTVQLFSYPRASVSYL